MFKGLFGAAALTLILPIAAFAQAGPGWVIVAHDDLDLSKPSDVRVLDRRLAAAVTAACPDARDAGLQLEAHSCKVRARARLRPDRARALAAASARMGRKAAPLVAAHPQNDKFN